MSCSSWQQLRSLRYRLRTCVFVIGFGEASVMSLESIIMLAVCTLLMVYLVYALLRPEKF